MDHPEWSPANARGENDEVAILVDRDPRLDSISGQHILYLSLTQLLTCFCLFGPKLRTDEKDQCF
jgi:hypothetical protein